MAERSTVAQTVQIGVESTPGTAVPADVKLNALGFSPTPTMNFKEFRPMGTKYNTVVALIKAWSESPVEGYPCYTEIVYPFCSNLVNVDPTGTGPYTWTFNPSSTAPDDVATFTVERGDDVTQAERMANGIIDEFGLTMSRSDCSISGHMLARRMEVDITKTPDPSEMTLVPVLPEEIDVYLDDDPDDFGETQLLRVLSAKWTVGGRFGPLWVLNSSLTSFLTTVELVPNARIEFSLEADEVGMALQAVAEAGTTKYMRIQASGPTIPVVGGNYSLTLDAAIKLSAEGGLGDQDGVYKIDFTGSIVHDSDWGQAMQVVVVNDIASIG